MRRLANNLNNENVSEKLVGWERAAIGDASDWREQMREQLIFPLFPSCGVDDRHRRPLDSKHVWVWFVKNTLWRQPSTVKKTIPQNWLTKKTKNTQLMDVPVSLRLGLWFQVVSAYNQSVSALQRGASRPSFTVCRYGRTAQVRLKKRKKKEKALDLLY